ncbi:hypothetical protein PCK1_001345 [Pneumocystis canis]|nr:hypothetical protein PCK1_001345 [Pneumocystis canis]
MRASLRAAISIAHRARPTGLKLFFLKKIEMNGTQIFWRLHYCDHQPTLKERYECYNRWNLWGRWMILGMALIVSHGEAPIKYTTWLTPGLTYPPTHPHGYPMHPAPYTFPPHHSYPAPPYESQPSYHDPSQVYHHPPPEASGHKVAPPQ